MMLAVDPEFMRLRYNRSQLPVWVAETSTLSSKRCETIGSAHATTTRILRLLIFVSPNLKASQRGRGIPSLDSNNQIQVLISSRSEVENQENLTMLIFYRISLFQELDRDLGGGQEIGTTSPGVAPPTSRDHQSLTC
ncbi:hypothetical protein FPOAC2_06540 [Fusarium poae]